MIKLRGPTLTFCELNLLKFITASNDAVRAFTLSKPNAPYYFDNASNLHDLFSLELTLPKIEIGRLKNLKLFVKDK